MPTVAAGSGFGRLDYPADILLRPRPGMCASDMCTCSKAPHDIATKSAFRTLGVFADRTWLILI